VIGTLVGYTGGTSQSPTYQSLGDHTETVRVTFDPTRVSYEQLLHVFWANHDPGERAWSRQYKAMILFHGDEQRRLAEKTRKEVAEKLGSTVRTEIVRAGEFYPAEDYHQKYYLRSRPRLMEELQAAYPDPKKLAASTAAARINGYLGGNGTEENFRAEASRLGLSDAALKELEGIVASRRH
jgi:methionine-S-sulfoxide reductase